MQWARMKDAERERDRMNVHVSGANARVNIRSTDQSTNIALAGNLFASIREAIATEILDAQEQTRVNALLDRVEAARDKTSFISAYQMLIGTTADHMTVLGPFLPALTQLLQGFAN
jgi:hypothetical protein